MQTKKLAIPYCRVSTVDQVKNFSLSSQLDAIIQYCQRYGLPVGRIFIEEGESGREENRPKFREMFDYIRENHADIFAVVTWDTSRFCRNNMVRLNLEYQLKQMRISVLTIDEPPNDSPDESPERYLLRGIKGVQDEYFSRCLSVNVKRGMKKGNSDGYWMFKCPDGYVKRRDESGRPVYDINPDRLEFIRSAFKLVASGTSVRDACKVLSANGWLGKSGKPLHHATLCHVLRNQFYVGILRVPKWGTSVKGLHQPIISEDLFQKVQEMLSPRQGVFACVKRVDQFPLRGFAKCSVCGRPLTACWTRGRSKKYPYYKCNKCGVFWNQRDVEKCFFEFLENIRLTVPNNGDTFGPSGKPWFDGAFGTKRELQAKWFPNGVYWTGVDFRPEVVTLPGLHLVSGSTVAK